VSRTISAQESINLLPEFNAQTSKQRSMVPRPGWDADATGVSEGVARQFWAMGGFDYCVVGPTVYRRESGAAIGTAWTNIGAVVDDGQQMGVADDGSTALLCGSNDNYVVSGSSVTLNNVVGIPGGQAVAYANGYWLKAFPDSNKFAQSDLDDPTTWPALDQAFERQTPGNIVDIVYDDGDVLIFKEQSVGYWYESGAPTGIAFDRVPQLTTPIACLSANSIRTNIGNSVLFLGREQGMAAGVYALAGRQFRRVSTPAIDHQISLIEDLSSAVAYRIGFASHSLYVLTFPNQAAYAFDASTGEWHRWQTHGRNDFIGRLAITSGNHALFLRDEDGPARLNPDSAEDGDGPIVFRRVTAPVELQGRPFTLDWVELDCDVGGLEARTGTSAGSLPDEYIVSLYVSENNGVTWQGPYQAPLGPEGAYNHRVKWSGLGMFREVVFRVEVTQPILPYLNGLRCGIRTGRA
jgi:hypothetical protein